MYSVYTCTVLSLCEQLVMVVYQYTCTCIYTVHVHVCTSMYAYHLHAIFPGPIYKQLYFIHVCSPWVCTTHDMLKCKVARCTTCKHKVGLFIIQCIVFTMYICTYIIFAIHTVHMAQFIFHPFTFCRTKLLYALAVLQNGNKPSACTWILKRRFS